MTSVVNSALQVAVDFGATTWGASWTWPNQDDNAIHTHRFRLSKGQADEFETNMYYLPEARIFVHGDDAIVEDKAIGVRDLKLAIMGLEPCQAGLKEACRQIGEHLGRDVTAVDLLQKFFSDVLHGVQEALAGDFRGHATFADIPKHCWVTYPVRDSDPLRFVLVVAAKRAGFQSIDGVEESIAATHGATGAFRDKELVCNVDIGGATMDINILEKEGDHIDIVCDPDGRTIGGEWVNFAVLKWFQSKMELPLDERTIAALSAEVDKVKRRFIFGQDTISPFKIAVNGIVYDLPRNIVKAIFDTIIKNAVALVKSQFASAKKASGKYPEKILASGGVMRNQYVFDRFAELVVRDLGLTAVEIDREQSPTIISQGALLYARSPYRCRLALNSIGITFIADYTVTGEDLPSDEVVEGIAWVIVKGQPETDSRVLQFEKTYWRETPRCFEFHIWGTTSRFDDNLIQRQECIAWDCSVTFPLTEDHKKNLKPLGKVTVTVPVPPSPTRSEPPTLSRKRRKRKPIGTRRKGHRSKPSSQNVIFNVKIAAYGQLFETFVSSDMLDGVKHNLTPAANWTLPMVSVVQEGLRLRLRRSEMETSWLKPLFSK